MDQLNSTTHHQKGKHISFEERVIIQTRLKDHMSPNKIAAELGCSPNTVRNDDLSIDACVGEALANDYFPRKAMLCTKTINNYIDKGLMKIRNHHLPEKISRKPKREQVRKNKRELGRSIEEHSDIDSKLEFGHWEADLVIGQKEKSATCSCNLRKIFDSNHT